GPRTRTGRRRYSGRSSRSGSSRPCHPPRFKVHTKLSQETRPMTKELLIVAGTALMAVALLAQPSPYQSPFQHPGWIAAPGSEPITVHMNRPEGQSGPVLAKPFSAAEVRHTVQTLADGTHVNHSDISAFYRDDRGRMRTESPTNVLIYDPVAGFIYHLDPGTK